MTVARGIMVGMDAMVLEGEAAAGYLGALFASANDGVPVNHAAVARDALRVQRGNVAAAARLRLAGARVAVASVWSMLVPHIPRGRGRVRARRRSTVSSTGSRGKPRLPFPRGNACEAISGPPVSSGGLR